MLNFRKKIKPIGGWLTENEGKYLYQIAKKAPKNFSIIEIGSWKGRSTVCFGLGSKDGKKARIYAIDPHTGSSREIIRKYGKIDTFKEFRANLKKNEVEKFIEPIKKTSERASKMLTANNICFVFIDGAHEFRFVKLDHDLWFPKLKIGGKIGFHDSWHEIGVHLYTAWLLLTSKRLKRPKLIDNLTIVEKTERNSLPDRFNNAFFIFYKLLFGWRGWVKLMSSGTIE